MMPIPAGEMMTLFGLMILRLGLPLLLILLFGTLLQRAELLQP